MAPLRRELLTHVRRNGLVRKPLVHRELRIHDGVAVRFVFVGKEAALGVSEDLRFGKRYCTGHTVNSRVDRMGLR